MWTITYIRILSKSRMISSIDSPRGQSAFFRDLGKYRYLSNASTVCDEIFTNTLKTTQITIKFKSFSHLIPIRKNLPPNLNKGFIEPPCISTHIILWVHLFTGNRSIRTSTFSLGQIILLCANWVWCAL